MVYKNEFGVPIAEATVQVFEDVMTRKRRYMVWSHSDYHPSVREWHDETPVEEIMAHMDADGFDCYVSKDKLGLVTIHCIHRETLRFIQEQKRKDDERFKGAEQGFIRYGKMPGCGRSKSSAGRVPKAGVACFRAEFAPNGEYRVVGLTPTLQSILANVRDQPAYRVYGEVVWIGDDGEPILKVEKFDLL